MEKRRYEYALKKFEREGKEDLSKTEECSSESEDIMVSLSEEFESLGQQEENNAIPSQNSLHLDFFSEATFPIGRPHHTPTAPRFKGAKKGTRISTYKLTSNS